MEEQPFNHTGYNEHLKAHKLMASRCKACGKAFLPPREMCPECYQNQMEWAELSGKGTLAAFTQVYVGLPEMLEEGYSRDRPYCSGIVRLDEGVSISAQIFGRPESEPHAFHVGMPVRAFFLERGPEGSRQVFLVFETAESA